MLECTTAWVSYLNTIELYFESWRVALSKLTHTFASCRLRKLQVAWWAYELPINIHTYIWYIFINKWKYNVFLLFQGGALLPVTSQPGFHMMVPLLTSYKSIQVSNLDVASLNKTIILTITTSIVFYYPCYNLEYVSDNTPNRWSKECSLWHKWRCHDLFWEDWSCE